jgi:hypothetical protein
MSTKYKDHDGTVIEGGYPSDVNANDVVEVVLRNGSTMTGIASTFEWTHVGPLDKDGDVDIVAYNIEELEVLTE